MTGLNTLYVEVEPNENLNILQNEIIKNIKPGSGIGSSAACAVGAVYGINKLLGSPLKKEETSAFVRLFSFQFPATI